MAITLSSIASSVEAILSPPDDFKSTLKALPIRSSPFPAVYTVLVSVEVIVTWPLLAVVIVTLFPATK